MSENPSIYVRCLAAYTRGIDHGWWVDAAQDVEDLEEEIKNILASSSVPNAEEFAVHDYDGFYDAGDYLGEYPDLKDVVEAAEFIQEHGLIAAKLISHFSGNIEEAQRVMEDDYRGCYESLDEFVEEKIRGEINIPEALEGYINWEDMADDMEINGEIFTIETGYAEIHVFWNS